MTRREVLAALLCGPLLGVRSVCAQGEGLTSLTIADASARLARGAISPVQLTEAYLRRIAQLNASLNAYVTVTADLARREARASQTMAASPLRGIPIAHKDLFETRGVRTTAGSLLFEDYVPDTNAAIVQQLARAGAVTLGKTNTHELGGGVTTINPFFGTTRNPLDQSRIAGGSSGGSAAAVAAHLCAAATGSDTGGSVRIPAAFCGCVGFKPTFGRISTQGLIGSCPTFDHVGFITRTVEDAQLMFSSASVIPPASLIPPARIAVARKYFCDDLDPSVSSVFSNLKYPEIEISVSSETMRRVFDPIVSFEIWGRLGADWRTNPGSFSKPFAGFFSTPRPSIAEYESALGALKEYQEAVDKLFDQVDVIVTPTVPMVAPPIDGPIDGMKILRNTWPFNAAGTPAISIPITSHQLPVGVQLVARRGQDDQLLRIARSFS